MNIAIKCVGLVLAVGAAATFMVSRPSTAAPPKPAPTGFAVVELFTSEGCSSCPPADVALNALADETKGTKVYALAFHVDYWDRLGWADPYADAAYSDRQRAYARTFKLDSIYTPQAIVNGTNEFVGSDRDTLHAAVGNALATSTDSSVTATIARVDEGLQLEIASVALPAGTIVNVAVVEDGLVSKVARGENGGQTLKHDNVVSVFRSIAVDDAGNASVRLAVPAKVDWNRASVVLFAQRSNDLHILAANEVALPK